MNIEDAKIGMLCDIPCLEIYREPIYKISKRYIFFNDGHAILRAPAKVVKISNKEN